MNDKPLAGADDELDRLLSELLEKTTGLGPSVERAASLLYQAAHFSPGLSESEIRMMYRVAAHDIHECAVRDAVEAIRKGEASG